MDRSAEGGVRSSGGMSMAEAFMPYIVLTVITLAVLLIKPLKGFLGQWSFGFALPETSTGYGFTNAAVECYSPLSPLTHASFFPDNFVNNRLYLLCEEGAAQSGQLQTGAQALGI